MRKNFAVCIFFGISLLALTGCSEDSAPVAEAPGDAQVESSSDGAVENSSSSVAELESSDSGDATDPAEYVAVSGDLTKMRVVIHDFQPNHSDFENFSEESVTHLDEIYNFVTPAGAAMKDFGYGDEWYAAAGYHFSCGNDSTLAQGFGVQIGVDGLPMQANPYLPSYMQQVSAGPVLQYGECDDRYEFLDGRQIVRGYRTASDGLDHLYQCKGYAVWYKDVIATIGMVQSHLAFTQKEPNGEFNMIDGVVVSKANERCDNANFDQWFIDVPSVNKRIDTALELAKDSADGDYVFYQGYNNGGFFPLDSIDPATRTWVSLKPCDLSLQPDGACEQFGPQSLSIFCPPYRYQYAHSQIDEFRLNTYELCMDWLNAGGPRAIKLDDDGNSAALAAVQRNGDYNIGLRHLRNFHFTMMAYAPFKYESAKQEPAPQFFEFARSGDMWVFVDGVLVADMGGDHMLVPGSVNLKTLAENNHGCHDGEPLASSVNCKGASENQGWADGSVHHLHIFYANRQTNGSEIFIRIAPAERKKVK